MTKSETMENFFMSDLVKQVLNVVIGSTVEKKLVFEY